MNVYPKMDIHFSGDREPALIAKMKSLATGLWKWQAHSTVNRPVEDGQYFFHRDGDGETPPCAIVLMRKTPGHIIAPVIVADEGFPNITRDQYIAVMNEFDTQIAFPAAESVEGITSVDSSKQSLEDYFSKDSVALVEDFCCNCNGLGGHPNDQKRWRAFLLHVYRNETERVHADTFGALLKAKGWWPEDQVYRLVHDYDFAMDLLDQYNES